jgi:hypothetical protein
MWSPEVRQPSGADRSTGSHDAADEPSDREFRNGFCGRQLARNGVGIHNVFLNAASYDWPIGVVIRPMRSAIPGRKAN